MRSPRLWLLAAKEFRELLSSRAYWLLLLMIGPLVGQGFIAAVNLYAEVSGVGGGPAALPQGLNRRNSLSPSDEAALREIKEPLRITVYLAAEDPRLMDLERGIIGKLRVVLPRVDVEYAAQSVSGLFETGEDHYGEVWYEMGGRKVMSRSTTEPIVLEELYRLAGIQAPEVSDEPGYQGYPLATRPRNAALIFYGLWPLMVCAAWWVNYKAA